VSTLAVTKEPCSAKSWFGYCPVTLSDYNQTRGAFMQHWPLDFMLTQNMFFRMAIY
jgi:hypothetical protein